MSAQTLIHCINQFASQHGNPVLAVLPDSSLPNHGVVEFKRKYPEPILSFSGVGLRAFYHCHTSESRPDTEHGHFHIFLKTNMDQWSHLAGLSMDNLGQPLQWFTVNHWVTGETWIKAHQLENKLEALLANAGQLSKNNIELELVEEWLLAMLGFYKKPLKEILIKRDQQISTYTQDQEKNKILQDRRIYLLSQQDINLLSDLESCTNIAGMPHYNA